MGWVTGAIGAIGGIAGGIVGGLGGSQKSSGRQGVDLGPSSSLQDLLSGQFTHSQAQKQRMQQIDQEIAAHRQRGIVPTARMLRRLEEEKQAIMNAPDTRSGGALEGLFKEMQTLAQAGPGTQDYQAGLQAQRDLAAMQGLMAETGGLPGQQDTAAAQGFAQDIFAPQQVGLDQLFQRQATDAGRQQALMGRGGATDPVMANMLAQSQGDMQAMLGAQQGAFAANMALQLPQQRLQAQMGKAQTLGALGDLAMSNRMNLLGLGSQLQGQERQFQIATGEQWQSGKQSSGGGIGGAISGALGGIGAGLNVASMFGGGGSSMAAPQVGGFGQQLPGPGGSAQFNMQQPSFMGGGQPQQQQWFSNAFQPRGF
jgi:hypothetical protein